MIFKPVLIAKILAGEKTVTRRPVNGDKPCAYKVGQEYSIQPGMARPTVARIRVLEVHAEMLHEIDTLDACLEGFHDRIQFLNYWTNLYGGDSDGTPEDVGVWRIEFELVKVVADVCICCDGRGVTELGTVRRWTPADEVIPHAV